jgi:hypothetical protein
MEQGAATAASAKFECLALRYARSAEQQKKVAYSQTDTGAKTIDPAQPHFYQAPD